MLGRYTEKITTMKQLFMTYSHIEYWRFEVVYSFTSQASSSALNFIANHPPKNVSCWISPQNGTTSTLYKISCRNRSSEFEIKHYSVYGRSLCYSSRIILFSIL